MLSETHQAIVDFYLGYPNTKARRDDIYGSLRDQYKYPVKQVGSIPLGEGYKPLSDMLEQFEYFNMIPVVTYRDEFLGFILRSPSHDRKWFSVIKFVDYFVYGLDTFKEFGYKDVLILVEGIKDCEAVKRVYPYCLSYLTSMPSGVLAEFLQHLSSNIVVISDNDNTKRSTLKRSKGLGFSHFVPPIKDLGTYLENNDMKGLKGFIDGVLSVV